MKKAVLTGVFIASAAVAPSLRAEISYEGRGALLGMLQKVAIHERCTRVRFTDEQAKMLDDRIVLTMIANGHSRQDVVATFGPALLTIEATTVAHPRKQDCQGAAKFIKLLMSM